MGMVKKIGEKTVVTLNTELVASELSKIKEILLQVIGEEPKQLVIDLANINMIDSMGIGVLIATHNSLQKRGKKLELINISENIRTLLGTMRLLNHFTITVNS